MTIFSDTPHDRRMERLMMTVPNFAPRGVGFRFTESFHDVPYQYERTAYQQYMEHRFC